MPKYRVKSPDGGVYEVNAPEGATEQDAIAFVQTQIAAQPAKPKAAQAAKRDYGLEQEGGQLSGRSLGAGRALNVLQGGLLNFGDEILPYTNAALDEAYGAITGQDAGDFSKNVDFYRGQAREIGNRMLAERPTESILTQIAGGLGTGGLGLTRAATGAIGTVAPGTAAALRAGSAGLGARAAQGAAAGVIGGGVAGAGAGTDTQSRVQGAVLGAGLGAPLGAALPLVTSGAGSAARFLQSTFAPATVNADRRAAGILGQAVARSQLAQGAQSPTAQLQNLGAQGTDNAAIADLSDELTALTGAVSRSPGQGRQIVGDFLRARQEGNPALGQAGGGQWADILDDIATKVSPSISAKRASEAVIAERAKQAKPLYDKALSVGPVSSPELVEIAQTPGIKAMLQKGVTMAKQRRELPLDYTLDLEGPIPVSIWHQAKQALDDAISARIKGGNKYAAGSLLDVQKRLLNALDDVTGGDYGIARNNFAGHSTLLSALDKGKAILQKTVTAEDIVDQIAKLGSKSEQEFYRAGAAQALRETVTRVGRKGNAAAKFLNRPDMQQKLQALFGNQRDYEDFITRMMGRDRQYRTYAELGGSPTAGRLGDAADLEANIVSGPEPQNLISAAATGGRAGIARAMLQRLQDGSVRFLSEKVRTKLAKMLTSTDPMDVRKAAQLIQEAAKMGQFAQIRGNQLRAATVQGGVVQPATALTEPR